MGHNRVSARKPHMAIFRCVDSCNLTSTYGKATAAINVIRQCSHSNIFIVSYNCHGGHAQRAFLFAILSSSGFKLSRSHRHACPSLCELSLRQCTGDPLRGDALANSLPTTVTTAKNSWLPPPGCHTSSRSNRSCSEFNQPHTTGSSSAVFSPSNSTD